ncbi:MAG TPA: phosphoribosylformylglycinamidine cyclo-ligase [Thermoplasmata archaeon]|nr:phosphoribosylformylglycinamidine cyclo-ligase [Thermoplasmata archaeon]
MVEPSPTHRTWTYARSGVDRSKVSSGLAALLAEVSYRPPPSAGRLVDAPGHYAGMVRIGRETIAVTTDTVGTKVKLAAELGRWEEVGEDIVGVNVNDLASVGARPSGLVDTILCRAPDPEAFGGIGRGLNRGLESARCALLGGETAVVPEIVDGIDLGATAFGFFPRGRRPVLGARIRPGDRLIGVPSSGLHANGFTLVRRLLRERSVDLLRPRPGAPRPIGEELLTPTRIYSSVGDELAETAATHGLAHLSGGGVRNLVRLHPKVRFVLDRWPEVPALFRWVQQLGALSDEEMFQTFNMGVGFVLVVSPRRLAETRRRLARAGAPDAVEVGHVEKGAGVTVPGFGLSFEGYS